ncbi:hypothetical protein CAPTEDRAFT_224384 [Capitella teleta]|uniref:Uncharacterized protein n=1 Tax=Capitella teleta TaxID=283909 RepID=R7USQ8_CAPTE|nr:hypothetical protein CAPTEDRAFT_224384 [Capitella teleta]|eukprot:ELU09173.1 hypothetical protein CAPTEDRAFT_224384 [Capitella teleta]
METLKEFRSTVDGKKPELARALFSGSMNESREVSIDSKRHSIDDESRVSESPAKSIDCSSEVKKKKKKAVRLIASRYMSSTSRPSAPTSHSTSNHRQPMRATDRDILKKSVPCKRPQPNVLAPKRTGGSARKLAPKVTRHRSVERTPDVSKPPGPKASTPEIEMSSHLAVDISAIDSHHSHHSHSSHLSTPGAPPQTNCKSNRSNSTSMKKADESSLPSSKTEEFSQTHVDILYARYLQTVYLEARAKHDFKLQEKHSMSQLHGLWLQNEQLQKRSAELKLQLSKLKHLNSLDTAVDDQLRGLSPVLPHLDVVQQQYSALAGALDTTRHQLSTKDVYLPDDELSFHENLTAALLESERLLGELSVMIRTKTPEISRFAQTLSSCTETVMKQLRHIDTCSDLVSSAHKLSTQECSLKIQDMQLKDIH